MSSEREIRYPIPGNDTGGRLILYGDANAPQILFFCGGFPDDCRSFGPLAERIAAENALCGVTCLPGFDYDDNETKFKEHGYSFEFH
jgi:hypothetical protein